MAADSAERCQAYRGACNQKVRRTRVRHYWDGENFLAKAYSPVLGLDQDAWDVYLLYDKDAEWKDAPPKPIYWQEQLGISDETKLDRDKLTGEIKKLLTSGTK